MILLSGCCNSFARSLQGTLPDPTFPIISEPRNPSNDFSELHTFPDFEVPDCEMFGQEA